MPKPSVPRCAGVRCKEKVFGENSKKVGDLPLPVKREVQRRTGSNDDNVLCHKCIRSCAFDWGFPRVEDSAIHKRRGVCAAGNFSCTRREEKLFSVPKTHQNRELTAKALTLLKIPDYAPTRCLCSVHKNELFNVLKRKYDGTLQIDIKRTRTVEDTPGDSGSVECAAECSCATCVTVRRFLSNPKIPYADTNVY